MPTSPTTGLVRSVRSEPSSRHHGTSTSEFTIRPAAPFRLDFTAWALRRRQHNRLDLWNGTYRRALLVGDRALTVQVEQVGGGDQPELTVSVLTPGHCTPAEMASIDRQVTQLLGTTADLSTFYDLAETDDRVGRLKERFLGVKPPRFPSLFEALFNAIANQQLSLEVGIGILNRFAERFGARPADDHGLIAFPVPEAVLEAPLDDLRALGFSMRKAEYVVSSAHAIASGELSMVALEAADRSEVTQLLVELHGIGRWSAEYVQLRGLGRIDVLPADDVGARNKLQRFLGLAHAPTRDEIITLLAPWDGCAGMIYFHLLLDGLAERGDIDA